MKRPFGLSWMQVVASLLCAALAVAGKPLIAILGTLFMVLGELATIREALIRQAGKEA